MATSSTTTDLQISGIFVDYSGSKKNIESAEVQLGRSTTPITKRDAGAAKMLRMTFDTPMKLSSEDSFLLRLLYYKTRSRMDELEIKFDIEEIIRECGAHQEHEYRKSHDRATILVTVSLVRNTSTESASSSEESLDLHPTTDDIFKICPRFRILVMGKTGTGKSSLISQAFGVQNALACDDIPGVADIEKEFISPQNGRFVLHDSQGFEPGDENHVKTVLGFIQRRRDMSVLKDKLHAIWLCFEIPRVGGRLLETGTHDFLRLKLDGKLGDIPVIVVLTKYDMLLTSMERTLNESDLEGLSDDDVDKLVKKEADASLQETCINPLEKFAGSAIPWVVVSTKKGHTDMVAPLIQTTEDHISQHVAADASLVAGVAQRVDPMLNIKTSIKVGKKRYWKALASTAAFKGKTVQACLEVLHTDIVRVWNFEDPQNYLESQEFKKLIVNLVDRLDVGSIANANRNMIAGSIVNRNGNATVGSIVNPNRNMTFGLLMARAIAGIMLRLAGPAAPIAVPITTAATWVRSVYQLPQVVLRHFIAYIVDLTIVLQTLYLLSSNDNVTRRMIKLAVAAYSDTSTITEVHDRIKYDVSLPVLNNLKLDQETLAMIEGLVNEFSIKASDIPGLRAKFPAISSQPDEAW